MDARHTIIFCLCLTSLSGCSLWDLVGSGDDATPTDGPSPEVRLIVSDGVGLSWLGRGGLEMATAPFERQLDVRTVAANPSRSRIVVSGIDAETGAHDVFILQHGTSALFASDVTDLRIGPNARWIWVEHGDQVALHHHEGGGVAAMSGTARELELVGLDADESFALVKEGSLLHVVRHEEANVTFDPGMGESWSVGAIRPDGVLLRPAEDEAGVWFNYVGEPGGAEDTIPQLGYTLRDGELTHRTPDRVTNVATGMPDDIDAVLASDSTVVLARRGEAIAFFDFTGVEIASYLPEAVPSAEGLAPLASRVTRVIPLGARRGVLTIDHTTSDETWSSVHAYALDDLSSSLLVQALSEGAADTDPGHFGHHQHSAFVGFVEASGALAVYDVTTGTVERLDAPEAVRFEAHPAPAARHY